MGARPLPRLGRAWGPGSSLAIVGLAQRCPLPRSWGWSARPAGPLLLWGLSWTGETPIPRLPFLPGVWGGQKGPGSRPRGSPGISHLLRVLLTAEALSPAGSAQREASAALGSFCCLLLPGSRATHASAETKAPAAGQASGGDSVSRWPPGPLPRPQLGVAGASSPWYLCPEGEGRRGSPAGRKHLWSQEGRTLCPEASLGGCPLPLAPGCRPCAGAPGRQEGPLPVPPFVLALAAQVPIGFSPK